jgi:superfamily I DNA/RNA helicase
VSSFQPSKYQIALFDWIKSGQGSAVIEAVAGSGKTISIVKALELIPQSQKAIFLAFNKSIADELKEKVPSHTVAGTFHSVGFKAWRKYHPFCQVDDKKILNLVKENLTFTEMNIYGMFVRDLVNFAKQRGMLKLIPDTEQSWYDIIDHFDLSIAGPLQVTIAGNHFYFSVAGNNVIDKDKLVKEAIDAARYILRESINLSQKTIDFNDMLYMPLLNDLPLEQYDYVFIDEAQDTNSLRRELAARMTANRLIAVGDSHQAIYGFTGADSDAVRQIRDRFSCQTLPLSINYRSGKLIIVEARKYVPEIEPREDAPDGIVAETNFVATPPSHNDAILCRNVQPLVDLAYQLISNGKGCRILGRDIGEGLTRLIRQMRTSDINTLSSKLENHKRDEVARFLEQGKESRAQSIIDKVECIQTIITHLSDRSLSGLLSEIDRLFNVNNGDLLTLTTIHKAKGLEWFRVFIYKPDLMPSKYAKQPWQMQQETNLQYVAVTRARNELYFVR